MTELAALSRKDIQPSYPNLHFETGIHISTTEELIELDKKYATGDVSYHIWRPEMAQRIRKYNPRLLVIDGLGFDLKINSANDEVTFIPPSAEQVWLNLPADPKEISNKDTLYIAAGDNMNPGLGAFFTFNPGDIALRQELLKKSLREKNTTESNLRNDAYVLMSVLLMVDVGLGGDLLWKKMHRAPITRRQTFGFLTGVFGAAALSRVEKVREHVANSSAKAMTDEEKDFFLKVADLVQPRSFRSKWSTFRTDLMRLKTLDSIDALGIPSHEESAIVVGSGHSFDSGHSEDVAKREVREYAEGLYAVIDAVAQKSPISVGQARKRIQKELATTIIQEVVDPQIKGVDLRNVERIEQAIKHTTTFESKRVLSALGV